MATDKTPKIKKPKTVKKAVIKKERESEMPDALGQYMSEISKLKPLKREEEAALSKKIQKGDVKALHELVRRNLKYVVTVANKYRGCGLSLQDLIEEGNIGIIQAAKRFANRLAAWIIPMFPSSIKSCKDNPHPRYLLATVTTYFRLRRTSSCRAFTSPF